MASAGSLVPNGRIRGERRSDGADYDMDVMRGGGGNSIKRVSSSRVGRQRTIER